MFGKTKEKVIKPVRDAAKIAITALIVALMALFMALVH
jgi:hypothetical protein